MRTPHVLLSNWTMKPFWDMRGKNHAFHASSKLYIHGYSWLFCKQALKNFTRFLLPLNLKGGKKRRQLQNSTTFIAWSWKLAASASHLFLESSFTTADCSGPVKRLGIFAVGSTAKMSLAAPVHCDGGKLWCRALMAAGSQHRQKQFEDTMVDIWQDLLVQPPCNFAKI